MSGNPPVTDDDAPDSFAILSREEYLDLLEARREELGPERYAARLKELEEWTDDAGQ